MIELEGDRTEFFAVMWGVRFLAHVDGSWAHVAESINGAKQYPDVPSCEDDICATHALIDSGERVSRYLKGKNRNNVRIVRVLIEEVQRMSSILPEKRKRRAQGRAQSPATA